MLTQEQLKKLRGQIVLNSLYTNDYKNDMNIEIHDVQAFFDGYVSYLSELIDENGGEKMTPKQRDKEFSRMDNEETLWDWYNCFDEDPLKVLPPFEEFEPTFEGSSFLQELYAHLGDVVSKNPNTQRALVERGQFYTDKELYDWLEVYDVQVLHDYAKANNLVDKGN